MILELDPKISLAVIVTKLVPDDSFNEIISWLKGDISCNGDLVVGLGRKLII